MVELRPQAADFLDAGRPRHHHRVARAAEVGRHLLGPLEGRVAGVRPADREVRERARPTPLVDVRQLRRHVADDAVEREDLVVAAVGPAFGARAVVAHDVEEDRVVELTHVAKRIHQPADFVVGVLGEAGEGFHLAREQPFLIGGQRIPGRNLGRTGRQLRTGRHHPQLDLTGQRLFAQRVPAPIELAAILLRVLLRGVMRRMRRSGGEIHVERLVRRHRLLEARPVDRLIGHVGREVIVRVVRDLDARHAVVDRGRPLVRLAADEAVELVEPRARRPAVVGPRDGHLPGRRLVILAKGRRAVAVHPQDLRQRGDAGRPHARVPRECRRQLHDRTSVVDMVVAARQQCRPRWRTERGRVEAVVAKPARRHLLERRHVDRAAEGAGVAEADVVDEDNHDVWGALRRLHFEASRRRRLARIDLGDGSGLRLGEREDGAIDLTSRSSSRRLRRGSRGLLG